MTDLSTVRLQGEHEQKTITRYHMEYGVVPIPSQTKEEREKAGMHGGTFDKR